MSYGWMEWLSEVIGLLKAPSVLIKKKTNQKMVERTVKEGRWEKRHLASPLVENLGNAIPEILPHNKWVT